MTDLNLLIDQSDEIQVPIALLTSSLTPAQIFVLLTYLAVMKNVELAWPIASKLESRELKSAGTWLNERGIVKVDVIDGKLSITVNMDVAIAA